MKTRFSADAGSGRADEGWAALTTLLSAFALCGGIGWGVDHLLHTSFCVVIGVLVGMGLGIYAVVARYGGTPDPTALAAAAAPSHESPWVASWESRLITKLPGASLAVAPTRKET